MPAKDFEEGIQETFEGMIEDGLHEHRLSPQQVAKAISKVAEHYCGKLEDGMYDDEVRKENDNGWKRNVLRQTSKQRWQTIQGQRQIRGYLWGVL